MNNKHQSALSSALRVFSGSRRWLPWITVPVVLAASWMAAAADPTPSAKPMTLSTTPLYAAGAAAQKPTLTLALSVEFPTSGTAYREEYDKASSYIGYFDNTSCYSLVDGVFARAGASTADTHECSGQYSGNFMNWAAASSIDILRLALTGGDRVTDTATDTVLQRAYLQDSFFNSANYFPRKFIDKASASKVLPATDLAPDGTASIYNCKNKIFFNPTESTCPGTGGIEVKVRVCESSGGLLTDPRSGLCLRYPSGGYKPVGTVQKYSDNVRLAAFGYLMDEAGNDKIYGGVLRAPMKWVGPTSYDKDGNPVVGLNPNREWDVTTGIFFKNPDNAAENISGVINYLNQFGRLGANPGRYKSNDPVSELYYEALRYLQGLPPTKEAVSNLSDSLKGGFPVYSDWTDLDPYKDGSPEGDFSCIRNNLFTIGDVYTHADWSVPGNDRTSNYDFARSADLGANKPDFAKWTNVVGGFESGASVNYDYTPLSPDGGVTEPSTIETATTNPNSVNGTLPGSDLSGLATRPGGAGGSGSYYMAGMAYWANTHDIRGKTWTGSPGKQRPGMRVKSYMLDVNELNSSSSLSARQKNQYFLAAKYGGFNDQSNKGNPFVNKDGVLSNAIWSNQTDENGDPKTYFLANSGQSIIDAVNEIFASAAAEGNNIAGAALSSNSIVGTNGNDALLYNTRFNGADWSGNVIGRPVHQHTDGSVTLGDEDDTSSWNAESELKKIQPVDRNIVMGDRDGNGVLTAGPLPVLWKDLPVATRTKMSQGLLGGLLGLVGNVLNSLLNDVGGILCNLLPCSSDADRQAMDKLGDMQLAYLRGESTYGGQPLGGQTVTIAGKSFTLRARTNLLGDIINSVVAYSGTPAQGIVDPGYYDDFYTIHQNRAGTVFVGANDGMLHAFDAVSGEERFAYIPSWMAPKLPALTDSRYGASSTTPHQAFVDAPPTVAEAKAGNVWKTVLVSGTGAGGQGVFALDVTDPTTFNGDKVLWEFTDEDDPTMGNVVGKPQVQKFKIGFDSDGLPVYKWFAVVASGVNNYAIDGHRAVDDKMVATADQALFLLDIGKAKAAKWQKGVNYFKLKVPADSTLNATVPPGIVDFSMTGGPANDVAVIYVGDLHGQLWKIDYALQFGSSKTIATAVDALNTVIGSKKPLFKTQRVVIKDPASNKDITIPQPIAVAPALIAGPTIGKERTTVLMLGTGKYLEASDNYLNPKGPRQSVYAILDDGTSPVTETLTRAKLGQSQLDGSTITNANFKTWGKYVAGSGQYPGWYFDFATPLNQGERQVSRMVPFGSKIQFNSLIPPGGASNPCASSGSRAYTMDYSTGSGAFRVSTVGNLGMPVLAFAGATTGAPNNAGGSTVTAKARYISVGVKGIDVSDETEYKSIAGPLSWRLIENYKQLKADMK